MTPPPRPTVVRNARYTGAVELKPGADLRMQVVQLAEELLEHLRNAGPDTLEIRVDIDAGKADGFPDAVARTIKENGTQLGLYPNRFEDI